jgi:hypothetical protein
LCVVGYGLSLTKLTVLEGEYDGEMWQHISLHPVIHKPVAVVTEQKEMCTLKKHAVVLLQ